MDVQQMVVKGAYYKYTEKRVWDWRLERVHWSQFGFGLGLTGVFNIWGFGWHLELGRLRERIEIPVQSHRFNVGDDSA